MSINARRAGFTEAEILSIKLTNRTKQTNVKGDRGVKFHQKLELHLYQRKFHPLSNDGFGFKKF